MWMINGQVTRRKREFTDGNGNRQRGVVLVRYSKEALAEIGVKPFREESYDKTLLVSTGYTDAEVDGCIIRTHTTENKYNIQEAKQSALAKINEQAGTLLQPTDFFILRKLDPTGGKVIPETVLVARKQLRVDVLANEKRLSLLTEYADIMAFSPEWTKED